MTTIPFFLYLREGSLRRRLLTHFFAHPGAKLFLREIAALLHLDPANLSREFKRLEREGLFRSELRGRQKYSFLNLRYPFYEELRSLILKTQGSVTLRGFDETMRRRGKKTEPFRLALMAEEALRIAVYEAIKPTFRLSRTAHFGIFRAGRLAQSPKRIALAAPPATPGAISGAR